MTKKTRVRVARIAAGAVIAAGASLTAAGAAQALEFGDDTGVAGLEVQVGPEEENPIGGADQGGASGENPIGGGDQGGGDQGGGDQGGGD
ncbi:hypothetical protein ACGF3L_18785, partial [Streptomyces parvus]